MIPDIEYIFASWNVKVDEIRICENCKYPEFSDTQKRLTHMTRLLCIAMMETSGQYGGAVDFTRNAGRDSACIGSEKMVSSVSRMTCEIFLLSKLSLNC